MKKYLYIGLVMLSALLFFFLSPEKEEFKVEIYAEKEGHLLLPQRNVVIAVLDLEKNGLAVDRIEDLEKLKNLQERFSSLSGVTRLESLLNASVVASSGDDITVQKIIPEGDLRNKGSQLENLSKEIGKYPELSPYINADQSALLFYIYYGYKTPPVLVYEELHKMQQEYKGLIDFEYTGRSPIIALTESLLTKDIVLFFPILLIMVMAVFLSFRNIKALIVSLFVLLLSIASAYSFIHFLGIQDSPLLMLIPVFSLGLLSDYLIHYFYHYFHTRQHAKDESLRKQLLFPLSLTAISTLTGFLSLIFIRASGHLQLGSIIAAAVVVCWAGVFFWLPYIDFGPPQKMLFSRVQSLQVRLFRRIARIRTPLFLLLGLAVLWGGIQISKLKIEPYPIEQLPAATTIKKADRLINDDFYGTMPFFLEIDTGKENGILSKESLLTLENIHSKMEMDSSIGYSFSMLTVLDRMHYFFWGEGMDLLHNNEFEDDFYPLLIEQYLLYYSSSVDPLEYESMVDSSYRFFSLKGLIYYRNVDSLDNFYQLVEELQEEMPEGWTVSTYGMVEELLVEKDKLRTNWIISFSIGSLLIFLTVWIFYRKLSLAILSLIPGILSMIVSFGIISLAHISIDAFSIIFVAIITGLTVDYSIHTLAALARFKDVNLEEGFAHIIGYSGIPILLSFITSLLSFSVLFLSSFSGARNLGILLFTSLVLSFFLSLYLLPLIILPYRAKRRDKK